MDNKKQNPIQTFSGHIGLEEESPLETGIIILIMVLSLLLAGSFFYLVIR